MPASKQPSVSESIYQIKVTLKGIRPPIWRRLQVPSGINLYKLHQIFQVAMGWSDSHLHQFTVKGIDFGEPDPDYGLEVKNERRAKLSQVISGEKARFDYLYDFGDSWEHEILVEKILPAEPEAHYPICIAGKRACPPDDCGGIWGYADLLKTIQSPGDPEYESMIEWLGEPFDSEAFDLDEINLLLKAPNKRRWSPSD